MPDALSRSLAAIAIDDMSLTADESYQQLRASIAKNPQAHRQFTIHDNIIIRTTTNGVSRILVPDNWQKKVIQDNHENLTAAHPGYLRTLSLIRQRYTWPQMHQQIREYVKSCTICRCTKPTNLLERAPTPLITPVTKPFEKLCIDYQGPFPLSSNGNRFLFVVIDDYSKFIMMEPMREATAARTVKFFERKVILFLGAPREIVSDRGRQFESAVFQQMLLKYQIEWKPTPAYHPQANSTEAVNKTIGNAIRSYIEGDQQHKKWDEHLSEIACALNSLKHTTTALSPYEVVFGMPIKLSGSQYHVPITANPSESERQQKLIQIRNELATKIAERQSHWRSRYNLRSRTRSYKPNDVVYRRNFRLSDKAKKYSAKLAPRYLPSTVEKVIGQHSYELRDRNGRRRVFPVRHLK